MFSLFQSLDAAFDVSTVLSEVFTKVHTPNPYFNNAAAYLRADLMMPHELLDPMLLMKKGILAVVCSGNLIEMVTMQIEQANNWKERANSFWFSAIRRKPQQQQVTSLKPCLRHHPLQILQENAKK